MITGSIRGGAELRYVAAELRRQAARGLTNELRRAQRAAVRPLQTAIRAEAGLTLPQAGGYAPLMARTVKATAVGLGLKMRIRVFARGRTELRDVAAVNAGRLRHPLFGDRKHWYVTHVRPGFVDRPVDELGDRVVSESLDALERVGRAIAGV